MEPTHWYRHNCEFCFASTKIYFEDERPELVHCPHCGSAVEHIDELDFDE